MGKIKNVEETYSIQFNQLVVKKENIITALGYKKNDAPPYVVKEIDTVLSEIRDINDLCAGYKIIFDNKIRVTGNGFYLGKEYFTTEAIITPNFRESEYVALFLATAGETISNKIRELNQTNEYLKAFVYDTIGSEISESACDYIQDIIEKIAKEQNLSITRRYSPGYCGWDVKEQHILFSFFPENFCQVKLTASSLMIPIKSVSGIIGIGKNAVKRNYGCAICNMTQCYKKRKQY